MKNFKVLINSCDITYFNETRQNDGVAGNSAERDYGAVPVLFFGELASSSLAAERYPRQLGS